MIYVIATLTMKPGTRDTLVELATPCIEATRREEGCISYDLLETTDDQGQLVFVERWESRAALEAHFHQPHLVAWRKAGGPHLSETKVEIIDAAKVDVL